MTAVRAVPQIDDVRYTHDPAENLTKAYNTQGHPDFGGVKRTECFAYDGLNRLTEAWTSAADNACAAAPNAGAVGGGVRGGVVVAGADFGGAGGGVGSVS